MFFKVCIPVFSLDDFGAPTDVKDPDLSMRGLNFFRFTLFAS